MILSEVGDYSKIGPREQFGSCVPLGSNCGGPSGGPTPWRPLRDNIGRYLAGQILGKVFRAAGAYPGGPIDGPNLLGHFRTSSRWSIWRSKSTSNLLGYQVLILVVQLVVQINLIFRTSSWWSIWRSISANSSSSLSVVHLVVH